MLEAFRAIAGTAPTGYEWMEYIAVVVVLLLVIKISIDVFFTIMRTVFKW